MTIFGCDIPCFAVTVEVLLCLVMVELILFNKFIGLAEEMYLFIIFENSHQLHYRGKLPAQGDMCGTLDLNVFHLLMPFRANY